MPIYIIQGKRRKNKIGTRKMGLSVSTTQNFENRDSLRTAAAKILLQSGGTNQFVSKAVQNIALTSAQELYTPAELNIQKASAQITINGSLRETLKYLNKHKKENEVKISKFGELWNIIETSNKESEENPYRGELYDFKIDNSQKNIFAA